MILIDVDGMMVKQERKEFFFRRVAEEEGIKGEEICDERIMVWLMEWLWCGWMMDMFECIDNVENCWIDWNVWVWLWLDDLENQEGKKERKGKPEKKRIRKEHSIIEGRWEGNYAILKLSLELY